MSDRDPVEPSYYVPPMPMPPPVDVGLEWVERAEDREPLMFWAYCIAVGATFAVFLAAVLR